MEKFGTWEDSGIEYPNREMLFTLSPSPSRLSTRIITTIENSSLILSRGLGKGGGFWHGWVREWGNGIFFSLGLWDGRGFVIEVKGRGRKISCRVWSGWERWWGWKWYRRVFLFF